MESGFGRFTGSTHDEHALITKAPATVAKLNEHLRAKIEEHLDEIVVTADLQPGARALWISYGITAGAMREAARRRRATGETISLTLTVQSIWPVPERAIARALEGVDEAVVAELNHGQYRREIERLARGKAVRGVHRVDGELIAPDQFEEAMA